MCAPCHALCLRVCTPVRRVVYVEKTMFIIKFTLRIGSRSVSVAIKTKKYERAVELTQQHRAEHARAYLGNVPLNLHTIRG